MPPILILLAGILIGADTGLELRRLSSASEAATGPARYFPTLSVASTLIVGIALAEAGLISILDLVPPLASYIAGPVIAIVGFVWFQRAMERHRLRPLRADGTQPSQESWGPAGAAPLRLQLGLAIRMGLLLPAAGVRTVAGLTVSILTAIAVATVSSDVLRCLSSPQVSLTTIVRAATGTLLCALGVGTELERLTQGAIPGFQIAIPLTVFAWGACAIALWRPPDR